MFLSHFMNNRDPCVYYLVFLQNTNFLQASIDKCLTKYLREVKIDTKLLCRMLFPPLISGTW